MRVYIDPAEMHSETARELKEMGIEYITQTVQDKEVNIETLELMAYSYMLRLQDTRRYHDFWLNLMKANGINVNWAVQETQDRLECWKEDDWLRNPGRAWVLNAEFWKQYQKEDGTFSYTYSERLQHQVRMNIEELIQHPQSRNALLTMWDPYTDPYRNGGRERVPCSMYYQFLIREHEGKEMLDMHYCMRSCDFKKFFLADAFMAYCLQLMIAHEVKRPIGYMIHTIGSLHTFKGELKDVF